MHTSKPETKVHLGLSFGYHDSAVAVIASNGLILFAEHEERLSRVKHDNSFPINALKAAFNFLEKQSDYNILGVGYYELPQLKEARKILSNSSKFTAETLGEVDLDHIQKTISDTVRYQDYCIPARIRDALASVSGLDSSCIPIRPYEHHHSHAAGAFFTSPFKRASAITLDGAGEFETTTIWSCDKSNSSLTKIWSAELPFSLGLFYSAITSYLGFSVNEGEYKVMGLSAYGRPTFKKPLSSLITFDHGVAWIDTNYFDFSATATRLYTAKLQELLGVPPAGDTAWVNDISDECGTLSDHCQAYCDIAFSAQLLLTEIQAKLVRYAAHLTNCSALCLSGGVALNSLANLNTDRTIKGQLYVFPPSGDAGSAIGAAYLSLLSQSSHISWRSYLDSFDPFLGSEYTRDEYLDAITTGILSEVQTNQIIEIRGCEAKVAWLAKQLSQRKIVALHQGRGEFGPRALGNRSILASAYYPEMKEKLNVLIKKREPYRPYAPAIAAELAKTYFGQDIDNFSAHPSHPLRYMASVVQAEEEMREKYPSAIHYDRTARVQLLTQNINPILHQLSLHLENSLGCGILLNTSFNLGYEALVGDPYSAVNTLTWSRFDSALLGDFAIVFE